MSFKGSTNDGAEHCNFCINAMMYIAYIVGIKLLLLRKFEGEKKAFWLKMLNVCDRLARTVFG